IDGGAIGRGGPLGGLGHLGHAAAGARREGALALHLHLDRLGAAVREALPDRPGVDRLLELEPARPVQRQGLLGFLLGIVSHVPIRSFFFLPPVAAFAAGSRPAATPRISCSRCASASSRAARRPGATATWTAVSRPSAAASSAALSAVTTGGGVPPAPASAAA